MCTLGASAGGCHVVLLMQAPSTVAVTGTSTLDPGRANRGSRGAGRGSVSRDSHCVVPIRRLARVNGSACERPRAWCAYSPSPHGRWPSPGPASLLVTDIAAHAWAEHDSPARMCLSFRASDRAALQDMPHDFSQLWDELGLGRLPCCKPYFRYMPLLRRGDRVPTKQGWEFRAGLRAVSGGEAIPARTARVSWSQVARVSPSGMAFDSTLDVMLGPRGSRGSVAPASYASFKEIAQATWRNAL
ncbi:uncharacterized protein B0I36DRAFT_352216 [Microdochium trichocladiopsis]|uniref:Uncharacterized protein n=1 Tax=Microdochium trichocladiopsis TaxID=1682393 RepID=A0A9P8XZ25_9PEZI|nr:uncharacterized protein B0I36DRAFT_352216 [Microdochium trichocladiopsis]KAH7026340.1 hypothetical protein B0I36DRAFT_352216 [Microdochium trichocladiopsis]